MVVGTVVAFAASVVLPADLKGNVVAFAALVELPAAQHR
jgi:hypothetical protein